MTADHLDSGATTGTTAGVLPSARTLGKGLAVLRIFMGVILFANGVAKLFGFTRIQVGPYVANLIDREAARSILQFEVFENPAGGQDGTGVPGVRGIAELMLDNGGLFGWAITAMELAVGALLIVGLLTRLAALGLGQALSWRSCTPAATDGLRAAARVRASDHPRPRPGGTRVGSRRPNPAPQGHRPGGAARLALLRL